jgi:hypothetical protein
VTGNPGGRPKIAWLRKKLLEAARAGEPNAMERIADHLIAVATKWEGVVVGYDRETKEQIRVASGRDSVAAAALLWSYAIGKPPSGSEEKTIALSFAEHFRKVELDRFQFAKELLGDKLAAMSPMQRAEFFSAMAPNTTGFVEMAEARVSPREPIEVEQLSASPSADGAEVPPSTQNANSEAGTTSSEDKP